MMRCTSATVHLKFQITSNLCKWIVKYKRQEHSVDHFKVNYCNVYKVRDKQIFLFLNREPKWSDDELLCARNVNNEIHFYENRDFSKLIFLQF